MQGQSHRLSKTAASLMLDGDYYALEDVNSCEIVELAESGLAVNLEFRCPVPIIEALVPKISAAAPVILQLLLREEYTGPPVRGAFHFLHLSLFSIDPHSPSFVVRVQFLTWHLLRSIFVETSA